MFREKLTFGDSDTAMFLVFDEFVNFLLEKTVHQTMFDSMVVMSLPIDHVHVQLTEIFPLNRFVWFVFFLGNSRL